MWYHARKNRKNEGFCRNYKEKQADYHQPVFRNYLFTLNLVSNVQPSASCSRKAT